MKKNINSEIFHLDEDEEESFNSVRIVNNFSKKQISTNSKKRKVEE
jgi:hypothetical protein